ncbi:hypothetical protein Tdes44962_MAKER02583 [Teratosphaeria destructans]|uniref:Uncharacterized protein n=1 Tax=Teratosphaeria destructans TaxID=418781 RepID=A0A9W7SSW2_9PEZI|nr:hypothetical protein Tdes44962_MAKER02583 [Teratosphaeria destructans]
MLRALAMTALMAALTIAANTPGHDCFDITGHNCPYDCSPESKDGLQAGCWAHLGMTDYINQWVLEHGREAGIAEKGFAQAYLSWSTKGYNGKTCNLITSETCDAPETDNSKYKNWQQFYTLWNIYAVHQFYNQYSNALSASQPLAASKMAQIVDKISPGVEKFVPTPLWLQTLQAAISWATVWVGPTLASIEAGFGTAGGIMIFGVAASSKTPPLGVLKQHYKQTAETRFQNLATIGSDLAGLVSEHQQQILKEVQAMLDNVESFIALCSPGGFSLRVTLSLTKESTALYKSMELFTISEALNANGMVITKSVGIDPRTVAKDTGEILCNGFGPAGNCYNWWYDSAHGNTYSFHDPREEPRGFTDLIDYIWGLDIVKDMGEIFLTEDCAGKNPDLDSTNLKPTCAVNVKTCEYSTCNSDIDDCCRSSSTSAADISFAEYDTKYSREQFTNCPSDPHWGDQCSSFANSQVLPASYLGPLLRKGNYCRHQ